MISFPVRSIHSSQAFHPFLLTAILISLFFGVPHAGGQDTGTARVVNYAGLVRGKTQRIVKLEISGTPEDDLLGDVAPTSKASASAAASWTWRGWTTRIFRPR